MRSHSPTALGATALGAVSAVVLALAAPAVASAPPVGPLPKGPVSTIQTTRSELVAVALPHRSGGRVWRIAGSVNAKVIREVSEADVGAQVVVVFRAVGAGTASVTFGLTRGETSKAYESRRYVVRVGS